MTVARLETEIGDTRELAGWMAYLEMEPPGGEGWHQAAMLALNARRIAGDKKSKLRDFLPQPPKSVESPASMEAKLRAMFGAGPRKPAPGIQPDDDDEE